MLSRIIVSLVVVWEFAAQAQYITGPRGGCYTISSSGRKRYVDRSLCSGNGSGSEGAARTLQGASLATSSTATSDGLVSVSDQLAARRLLEWFKAPSEDEIERALKRSLAKRLGLTRLLSSADQETR